MTIRPLRKATILVTLVIVTDDFEVYLVDLDSIKPLETKSQKCKSHQDCLDDFDERLWVPNSLNHKISWNCREEGI